MKIGILSDSHGDVKAVIRAFDMFRELGCSTVFHLGDGVKDMEYLGEDYNMEVLAVRGNMDPDHKVPLERIHTAGTIRFFLAHGHELEVHRTSRHLIHRAKEAGCQVALHGHSHIPVNIRESGILLVNPGSVSRPKGPKASLAVIDTDSGEAKARILWLWEENTF